MEDGTCHVPSQATDRLSSALALGPLAGHEGLRRRLVARLGKAERFIKTLFAEWAYARRYRSNEDRLAPSMMTSKWS